MRALAVCQCSYVGLTGAGGAERMLHSLLKHLVTEGWTVDAAAVGKQRNHVNVDGVNAYHRKTDTDMYDLARPADLIITQLGGTQIARSIGRRFNKPVAQLIHNTNQFSSGFLGSGTDFAIYNAQWVKEYHEKHQEQLISVFDSPGRFNYTARKQSTWPSCVIRPPVIGEKLKSQGGYITLINLVDNKGPEVLYGLAEMNPDLQFMGVIGGYQQDQQVVRVMPNVKIHDHVLDMDEIYSQTSVVLVPSRYESYGLVGIEAARYGIPAIATPTPGLLESLGNAGMFREREDIAGWNDALHYTLDNYDERQVSTVARYTTLEAQSITELANFEKEMRGLVTSWA